MRQPSSTKAPAAATVVDRSHALILCSQVRKRRIQALGIAIATSEFGLDRASIEAPESTAVHQSSEFVAVW